MAEAPNKIGGDIEKLINDTDRFALINRLILRDVNKYTEHPVFPKFNKNDIVQYLNHPSNSEKHLRKAVNYIYSASSHFRRLIQYFVGLSDLSYIVEPYKLNKKRTSAEAVENNYRKTLNLLSSMNIKNQFPKILTVCLREDVFYGTLRVTDKSIIVQQLPSDYCCIATIEDNVPNVQFDFSYFDRRKDLLEYFPDEFREKYELYKSKRFNKWIELNSPNSFAIKCNTDVMEYAVPPFAGILREIYDIEDYKRLKLTKTALENYALVFMSLPMMEDGSWGIDYDKAKAFWSNLDSVLPEEVGSVLSPMDIKKIDFEKSNTGDTNTIASAEQNLYTAAGVSSLLFNNENASANALLLSIKADQSLTYGIVKSIEDMVNRFIHNYSYGKNFKINFLDVSPYNRKEVGEAYLKAASYGLPTISAYAASQGIPQTELDAMSYLEADVLKLPDIFKPIRSSTQMSSEELEGGGATDGGGAPEKDAEEITESGEMNREAK